MRKETLKFFALGGALVLGGLAALAVGDLIAFSPGTPIRSADVNANFSTLRSAIQALEAPAGAARLADGAVTLPKLAAGGAAADGRVLKAQGGALVWGDDLTGAGGTAYSAGAGLSLSGSTFSVANGGVTGAMLAQGGAASGQVLKWNGSAWAPAADTDTNTTYTAGSGLTLSGTQFSVSPGTVQARVSGNCAVGSSIRQINADGSVLCEADARFGGGLNDPNFGGSGECTIAEVRLFAGNFAVRGWAHAAGQTLSISSNTALFSVLGTTYGGNGTTTFMLPDLRGVTPKSANGAPVSYMICLSGVYPSRP